MKIHHFCYVMAFIFILPPTIILIITELHIVDLYNIGIVSTLPCGYFCGKFIQKGRALKKQDPFYLIHYDDKGKKLDSPFHALPKYDESKTEKVE